ncbi:DNA topoisomerase III [Brevibacillus fulvus]|uniref:DNA topoisomerase n=1 Tax=Brevibacillus fulvus TaxID=1125967 RepID=A0A938Y0J7_9BACL|nr:DNA topoisomerase III [Brevibacillus fulvus]MBM7589347.1 DNA topoisomerase-3 [Brevibacillus fulvus]
MKLIIAEKPDQAAKLAQPFRHKKQQGYIEVAPDPLLPQGALITWAIGHICELLPPEEYNPAWKKWSKQTLPMIPPRFQHRVIRGKAKQFGVIKQLLKRADVTEIIHAGDAGREGELIVRTILSVAGTRKPMKRLWISSLTDKAVRDGFAHLLDEQETRNLYHEAFSRACADWLVGMNASRIYTILLKEKGIKDVFSAGRVQTPTLALVVKREKEIAAFQPKDFWEVVATFQIDDKRYEGTWHNRGESRLDDEEMAQKIAAFCERKPAEVAKVNTERKEFQPPFLFNLSSLQATANRLYKFSPKKTLDIAQQLYLKGYLSYPRSDSSFVTAGEAQTFPDILAKLKRKQEYASLFPTPVHSLRNNRRYVNEKKVTDHYAIIPTEQVPDLAKLSSEESKLYDLVARRLIAAHYDAAVFDYTTITTLVDGRAEFISKGKVQINEGWRKVIMPHETDERDEEKALPAVAEGESGKVKTVKVKAGKTQPPKRYTEGQLITLMKTAGKHLDNEELEKVLMKTEGLGTEATRAGIITMLKERKYIEVKKNQVFATEKGMLLIDLIGDKILASPEMTARWEQRLAEIGQGEAPAESFMEQARKLTQKIVQDALEQSAQWNLADYQFTPVAKSASRQSTRGTAVGKCQLCGGEIVDKGKLYGCANYQQKQCKVTIPKKILNKTISAVQVKKMLESGKSGKLKGFKKGDKTFDAYLRWDGQNVSFAFE